MAETSIEGEAEYFIRLDDPDDLRKMLLGSSKQAVLTLKDYHLLLSLRKDKVELIEILKDQIRELTFLIEQLDKTLPDKKIEYEKDIYQTKKTQKTEEVLPQLPKEEKKPAPKQDHSDVAALEQALANIEKKLNKL